MSEKEYCYSISIPKEFTKTPHLVFLDGRLVYPGKYNDYTISLTEDNCFLIFWNPEICKLIDIGEEMLVAIVDLKNGGMWAHSSKDGLFVDTRETKK